MSGSGAAHGSNALILCYHALSEAWNSPLTVTPQRFRDQMASLAARGYRSVGFTDAVQGAGTGRRRVAITFDDACRSVDRLARPILDEFGFSATVFIPTKYIGSERPMSWPGIDEYAAGPDAEELVPMSWAELNRLAEAGWEIGSHTLSHPDLTKVDDETLELELVESRSICEQRLGGRPCTSVAYPYGAVDVRVEAAARSAGYLAGGALMYAKIPETQLSVRRVGVHQPDAPVSFRLKTSPIARRLWRTRAWAVLELLIRKLRP